jgi:hypothetical protein
MKDFLLGIFVGILSSWIFSILAYILSYDRVREDAFKGRKIGKQLFILHRDMRINIKRWLRNRKIRAFKARSKDLTDKEKLVREYELKIDFIPEPIIISEKELDEWRANEIVHLGRNQSITLKEYYKIVDKLKQKKVLFKI